MFPASLMELFYIAYFGFDIDGQINIGGTFGAPQVTSVKDYSRDPVKKKSSSLTMRTRSMSPLMASSAFLR